MLEAYRVGATLVLENGIGQQLSEVIAQFEQLDRIIRNTNAAARELASVIKGMATFGAAMGGAAAAADKMSSAATGMARAMPDVTRQAEATANAMERAASASFALVGRPYNVPNYQLVGPPYTPAPSGALAPYQGGGPAAPYTPWGDYSGYQGPHTAYARSGPMAPYAGGGGGAVPPPIALSWGSSAQPSGHDFALAALGYGSAGRALTGFTGDVIGAGTEYGHQMTMLRSMGWSDADLAGAGNVAMAAQRDILGVTSAGALEAQRDIYTITRNMKESMQLAPDLLRASVVLSEVGKGSELQQLFQALQAGELRGVISAEHLPNFIRLIETAAVTTGGRAGPAEILQFLRSSGVSGRILANPDLFGQFIPEIMSMGASRAGTGLQAFFQQFGTGRMSDAAVKTFLEQMGLAKEGEKFIKAGIGQWMALPGGLKGEELVYGGNEAQFMRDVLLPAIDEYNKSHFGYTNAVMEARTGAALSSRIPGGRFLGEYFTLLPLSDKYSEAMREGSARDAYQTFAQNDPTPKARGLQASWTGFLTALSSDPVMDAAMKVLQGLTGALNGLGSFAERHKTLASTIVGITGALGALAVGIAGLSAVMWVGGPMARAAGWAARGAQGAALTTAVMRPGMFRAGLVGAGAMGAEAVNDAVGGPDWLSDALYWGGMGGMGAGLFGPELMPAGFAAGFVGGAAKSLWSRWFGPSQADAAVPPAGAGHGGPGGPVPVFVTNANDLGNGVMAHIGGKSDLPPNGPAVDSRQSVPHPGDWSWSLN